MEVKDFICFKNFKIELWRKMLNGCSIIDRFVILVLNLLIMFLLGFFCIVCIDKIWICVVLYDCFFINFCI